MNDNLEKCVNCGHNTQYLVTDHIDRRICYVIGVGQLCVKCYVEIYGNEL